MREAQRLLPAEGPAPDKTHAGRGSAVMQAQLKEQFAPARIAMVQRCFEGLCSVTDDQEEKIMRGAHMIKCCQLGTGHASVGNVTCGLCRAKKMVDHPSVALVKSCTQTALAQMATVAASSAGGFAELCRLMHTWETHYSVSPSAVAGRAGGTDGRLDPREFSLPVHNIEAAMSFVNFLSLSDGPQRVLSLQSIFRMMSAYCGSLKILPNVTKDKDLKRLVEKRVHAAGKLSTPRTTATRAIVVEVFETILPRIVGSAIRSRNSLEAFLEANGLRVGECTNHGQGHGADANDSMIAFSSP